MCKESCSLIIVFRKYVSDDEIMTAQHDYMKSIDRYRKHLYLLKLRDNCQHLCHEILKRTLSGSKSEKHLYSIVNRDHALIHISPRYMESFMHMLVDEVSDFAPVLPQFKVSKQISNVHRGDNCTDDGFVDLHVTFFPMDQQDVERLHACVEGLAVQGGSGAVHFNHPDRCLLPHEDEKICTIRTSCTLLEQTVAAITALPFSQWVDRRAPIALHTRWANGVVQSGSDQYKPIHDQGLTGSGLVIGIADTGLDPYSCFFYDENMGFPYDYVDQAHRKVVYYNTFVDNADADSHGTMVSSIAAGNCPDTDSNSKYNGAAYDSKVAFFDIGSPDEKLIIPDDINTDLFQPLHNAGAAVQSMSWGARTSIYETYARCAECCCV